VGDMRLLGILKQKTSDMDLKQYAVKYMEELGAFTETKKVLEQRFQDLQQKITQLGGNDKLLAIVRALMSKVEEPVNG